MIFCRVVISAWQRAGRQVHIRGVAEGDDRNAYRTGCDMRKQRESNRGRVGSFMGSAGGGGGGRLRVWRGARLAMRDSVERM